jgi:type VI secretion system VasD/TssJ family lipoprotein
MEEVGIMDAYTKFPEKSTARSRRAVARFARALGAALICALLAACSASQPPQPAPESDDPHLLSGSRADKAIRLRFNADRDLNVYDSRAHSLQICVYQLDKPDAFKDLAKTQEGVTALLTAAPFDKSVRNVVRLFVQPLEDAVFELDREEKAAFVGIVCGYFDSTPENSAKLWEIKPKETTSGHLFWKSTTYSAGTLDITLRLSARAMAESKGQQQTPQQEPERAQ